jgi:hypothetical protein
MTIEKTQNAALATVIEEPTGELLQIYNLIVNGDLSRLKPDQRLTYYQHVCKGLGLNPATKPLEFITLKGKMVLYALKEAAVQLARRDAVSVIIVSREKINDEGIFEVTCRASTLDGRVTDEVGSVPFSAKLTGEDAANARMKAVTKAKRRAILSHCGLGMLDETEIETIASRDVIRIDDAPKIEPMSIAQSNGIEAQFQAEKAKAIEMVDALPQADLHKIFNLEHAEILARMTDLNKVRKAMIMIRAFEEETK